MPITECVWITRERTTLRHLRGLVEKLDANDVAALGAVRIVAVPSDLSAGALLAGLGRDGEDIVLTDETLPAEGILYLPND